MGTTFDRELTLAGRKVGEGNRVFVIAEAGVAHFGSLEKARGLVDLAARAGADVVKFQVFRADDLVASAAPEWQSRLRRRELPPEAFREIRDYCVAVGIPFCATAHDEGSLDVLDELGVPFYKIGSGEVSNWRFIENIARQAGFEFKLEDQDRRREGLVRPVARDRNPTKAQAAAFICLRAAR